jgi:hypothetical protein
MKSKLSVALLVVSRAPGLFAVAAQERIPAVPREHPLPVGQQDVFVLFFLTLYKDSHLFSQVIDRLVELFCRCSKPDMWSVKAIVSDS